MFHRQPNCSICDGRHSRKPEKWEISRKELKLYEVIGAGAFGEVRKGKWMDSVDVAVKTVKDEEYSDYMTQADFIREAKIMTELQHPHLVQIYGMCTKKRPLFIVTEYMDKGSLLGYLHKHQSLLKQRSRLRDICVQVCKGMKYLERNNYIHRDLAARNCLVRSGNIIKVSDFGLTRDDTYMGKPNSIHPIRWSPPEVLSDREFSIKSDVWAFGILMWEVYTCGKVPYGSTTTNETVIEKILEGMVLVRPDGCSDTTREIMKSCWTYDPEDRPSFKRLLSKLTK